MSMRRLAMVAATAFLALGCLAASAQAQTGNPSFNLVNRSDRTIVEAYASPSSDSNWGEDRLGTNVLPAGQTFAVRLPQGECVYDVRVIYDRQGGPAEERRNVNLCNLTDLTFDGRAAAQGATPPVQQRPRAVPPAAAGPTGNPSFNLVNQGRATVLEVFATLAGDQNWGPDRLGADTVAPGGAYAIRLPEGPCLYNLRIVYDTGHRQERRNINLCEITNLTVPLQ